jgi:hypothetical protein
MSEPAVVITLAADRPYYEPGDVLSGSYRLEVPDGQPLRRVELSVLWYTEGKGDEDLAVHFFSELIAAEGEPIDPYAERQFSTRLPPSPLSYDGLIVQVRWCVRVRAEFTGGKDVVGEVPFRLGNVAPAGEVP